jgi:hypothetical protein
LTKRLVLLRKKPAAEIVLLMGYSVTPRRRRSAAS